MSTRGIVDRVAPPLLASMFVAGGLDAFRHPDSKVKRAEKVTQPLAGRLSALPDDTATLVRLNGGVQVVAGCLLALGIVRRTAAFVLATSIVPTTVAGHAFWEELDDGARAQQRVHFLKNLGLLGGLLLVTADHPRSHGTSKSLPALVTRPPARRRR